MGKEANTLIKRLSMGFKLDTSYKPADWLNLEESSESDQEPVVLNEVEASVEKPADEQYYDEESDSD
jgi:hypothetical protein